MSSVPVGSLFLFFITLLLLLAAAYGGKFIFKRRLERAEVEDDEAKLILGAILSLLGLLLGLAVSVAIGGYEDRLMAEENEAVAIGTAWQRTQLLPAAEQEAAKVLLAEYLTARVQFFESGLGPEHQQWGAASAQRQRQLWDVAVQHAKQQPDSISTSILAAYSDLYQTQQRTQASWRHRIPPIAWWVLLSFSFFANGLIGYNIRGIKGENLLIIILPVLTTAAFYLIAEIDIPGEGVIRVGPEMLMQLNTITPN